MATKNQHNFDLDIEKALAANEELTEVFPELGAYPEFLVFKGKDLNKFIGYLFFAYHPGSAFIKIKDIEKRKDEAAIAAGLQKINSVIKDRVVTAKALIDAQFTAMLTRFFKSIVQDDEFEEWVSAKEFVAQLNENVRNGVDASELKADAEGKVYKIKAENLKEIPVVNARIKELSLLLFKGDADAQKAVGNEVNKINMGVNEELYLEDD